VAARPRTIALLLIAGAALSAVTMLRGIDPFDEGFMLATVDRLNRGQVLYGDFTWPYGPGHPYLLGALADVFGRSLLWWRIVRVLCDAGVAVLVYVMVRRRVNLGLSLTAWLCAACAMAQPVSANPFPPALLMGLGALALATAPSPPRRLWLWAGLLTGGAALWRLDFGLYAAGAVGLTLLLRAGPGTRERLTAAGRYAAVAAATALAGYAPFLASVGPADLYAALVGDSSAERDYWTLPFPLGYDGPARLWPPGALAEDAKDVLEFYVPLLVTAGVALSVAGWVIWIRRRAAATPAWPWAGGIVFGLGGLLYLLSRADEFHANPGIVALALSLPLAVALLWPAGGLARGVGVGAAGTLALLTLYGVANRLSATLRPLPSQKLELPVADGVSARPVDARALPPVVAKVRALAAAGTPIYVTTRRSDIVRYSNPLLYVLTDRPNILDRDVGLFAHPREQRKIVRRLRERRPAAVVRWTDPISSRREPNLRGDPSPSRAVDRYLDRAYRPVLRTGRYVVLAPRGVSGGAAP